MCGLGGLGGVGDEGQASVVVGQELAGERDAARGCLLYTSPSPRDRTRYRMPSSA